MVFKIKKILSIILSLAVFLCIPCSAFSKEENSISALSLAQKLNSLNLFLGTENGFDLDKPLTRTEAIVMLIRTLGKESDALSYGKTHPFSDVATWADGYISYAYTNGLTKGVSETVFGAETAVESNMYLTFILRALGHTDENNKDFLWQMPYALASKTEILPPETDFLNFTRADAVYITAASLYAKLKNTDIPLYQKLISDGIFSKDAFLSAFSADPFEDYKSLNKVIGAQLQNGKTGRNKYTYSSFIIYDVTYTDQTITAAALSNSASFSTDKNNVINSNGSSGRNISYTFDKDTFEFISENTGCYSYDKIFPQSAIGSCVENFVWKGFGAVINNTVESLINTGIFAYVPATYEDAMAELIPNSAYKITQQIETDICTIVLGRIEGTPHGSPSWLTLVYKSGSAYGEGKTIGLPMPNLNGWGLTDDPEILTLSEDGLTLYYSYSFSDEMILEKGTANERIIHEKGTYNYTVDLQTGTVNLEIAN